jgi:aarF domain-containing kinase
MGFTMTQVMTTMVNLFAAQVASSPRSHTNLEIFKFGWVHCDPHPGNVFIRHNPTDPQKMQLVLIDHGLYIAEPEPFRLEYCQLWKAVLTWDNATLTSIATKWGIQFPDILASATLLSPYRGAPPPDPARLAEADDSFKAQMAIRDKLRNFLTDTEKIPLELIFLGRNMRIVQATNQLLGSPVNRPGLMADWASRGLQTREGPTTWGERVRGWVDHVRFRVTLRVLAFAFWVNRVRQVVFGSEVGWEDVVQRQLKAVARANFGIELKDEALLS